MATHLRSPPWTTSIILFYTVFSSLQLTYGLIRCYCDSPTCVGSGYMCKSNTGCYSELYEENDSNDRPLSPHGCMESVDIELCETGETAGTQPPNRTANLSILKCCKDDLCNYNRLDNTDIIAQNSEDFPDAQMDSNTAHDLVEQSRAVWFRAAVIAVPIAGGCILILLILLAVRMLRNEEKRFKRLQAKRRDTFTALHRGCYDNRNFKNVHINIENNLQTKGGQDLKPSKVINMEVKNVNELPKSVLVVQWDKHNINENVDAV
ncbi:BMP and activin membrane-bound inhibitor homolog precursor [Saccoglossus kowalevskii]|uniref:BMP and activin membrane-bound inhibitor homolog precursor n=1 Tax=Saccoglossus kowalevskii TaxID=10224 RepID=Q1PHR5_SACKO|nr:BMP and activin membrane-bound inhibitor homolog precursor [Saccoglossus kowalevskii]ABD97264.1 bambi [Saccoglossus kowalevskii]